MATRRKECFFRGSTTGSAAPVAEAEDTQYTLVIHFLCEKETQSAVNTVPGISKVIAKVLHPVQRG